MHSARMTYEDQQDAGDQEPVVLSYVQFRNHLGLLDWRRRRAQYEQRTAALSAALRQPRDTKAAPAR
jgi:hypothetical protein